MINRNGGLLVVYGFQLQNSTIMATRRALVGHAGEYLHGKEDITSYIERVELYFATNFVHKDVRLLRYL